MYLETETGMTKAQVFIDVRGLRYTAERLTKTNYIALGSLVREKGKPMPDLTQPGTKMALAEQMLAKFADPDFMKRLCYSLLSIFPTLATNRLVWFEPDSSNTIPPFGTILEPEEILEIITIAAKALTGALSESKTELSLYQEQADQERIAKIAQLEAELEKMRANKN